MDGLSKEQRSEVDLLVAGKHPNPHQFLGLHQIANGQKLLRVFAPEKQEHSIVLQSEIRPMTQIHRSGIFSLMLPNEITRKDYRLISHDGTRYIDPYSFPPLFTNTDGYLFHEGKHYKIYDVLGSHVMNYEGVEGTRFAVWAPNAHSVSVVGDFNGWKERTHLMRKIEGAGVWELFVPGCHDGANYKYSIVTPSHERILKSDPFARRFELRPLNASIVSKTNEFIWHDADWIKKRRTSFSLDGPMNIYEMHLGSWAKKKHEFPNYREVASEVVAYVKDMGFTHVEILPITEHPFDESWGYQVTGYFAPTSRYGSIEDFQYMINHFHMHGIGVILDWSPAHFPSDEFSLGKFDGTCCYEKDDELMGWHPVWKTQLFDYSKNEVKNFLIASALFWIEKMHIDAIRVDAVESMLYLDYFRESGEWKPNVEGGNENLEAIEFLKKLNSAIHELHPGVITIAEDASLFPKVTQPVEWGGLGFDMKWNLGWTHDTHEVFKAQPEKRLEKKKELFQSYQDIFRERYVLPCSHDEVANEKKNFFPRTPVDEEKIFSDFRLYYSAAMCHPGKKLFFMGHELAQRQEWNVKESIHWHLLSDQRHILWKRFVRKMNLFYLKHPALWEIDFDQKGFAWIDKSNYNHPIISFIRHGVSESLVCVHNFADVMVDEYQVHLPKISAVKEVFNTESIEFGGTDVSNLNIARFPDESGFTVHLPPLSTVILAVKFHE